MSDNLIEQALTQAVAARARAYAPYSKFQVGAALKLEGSDEIVTGCNIENSSYGATICAERTAILKAVSEHPEKPTVEWMVLVTDTTPASTPCGACLQVMSEFLQPDTPIHLANLQGIERVVAFKELMPYTFELLD